MKKSSLMIVGLGDLNTHVLEFLAREPRMPRILTADINEDLGYRTTNNALIGASQFDKYPEIEFVQLDAFDIDRTAELLAKARPKVIVNGMTLQSWWVITTLPSWAFKKIDEARFGPWFPMHFLPAYKLMKAVKKSGIETKIVNCAFPDAVNVSLDKIGLAPTVGIGNVDNAVCQLRIVVAKTLNVPVSAVTVYMACAHYTSYYMIRFGNFGGSPCYMKIMVHDKDVTGELNIDEIVHNMTVIGRRLPGTSGHGVVASSICKIVKAILFNTNEIGHGTGPNGLPGGYPVQLNSDGVEVYLPEGLSLEKAIEINEVGNRFDGIDSIEDDGSVIITDSSIEVMKTTMGFHRKKYVPENCEKDYKELSEKFKSWVEKVKSESK